MGLPETVLNPAARPTQVPAGAEARSSDELLEKARADSDTVLKQLESRSGGLTAAEADTSIKRRWASGSDGAPHPHAWAGGPESAPRPMTFVFGGLPNLIEVRGASCVSGRYLIAAIAQNLKKRIDSGRLRVYDGIEEDARAVCVNSAGPCRAEGPAFAMAAQHPIQSSLWSQVAVTGPSGPVLLSSEGTGLSPSLQA